PASSGSSLLPSAPSPPSVQPGVCASVGHAVCSAASTSLSASATVSLVGDSIGSTSGGAPRFSSTASSGSSRRLDTRSALPLAAHRFRRQPRFHRPLTRSDRPPAELHFLPARLRRAHHSCSRLHLHHPPNQA